jgi:AraC family transcriptional regulator of adaptative response/methylated-DNA-[protein]-cysteine methyltransferase
MQAHLDEDSVMPPMAMAQGPQTVTTKLKYTITPTDLGNLLLAVSDRGVRALFLGENRKELESELREQFPDDDLIEDPAGLRSWANELSEFLAGRAPLPDLPVDAVGSEFQLSVWRALRAIPFGETRTYGEIARSLGQPGAARAVGRACATNPVGLLIPCHRAVRGNGELGGFRCGVDRKKKLLRLESRFLEAAAAREKARV